MDELRIKTAFMRKLVGKILERKLKKAIGCDISTDVNKFEIESTSDGKYRVYMDLNGEIDKSDLERLLAGMIK